MPMTVRYGTKSINSYDPAAGETFRDILRGLCRAHRLEMPENVTVTEDGAEKRLGDIPQNNGSVVVFRAVAATKGF